MFTVEHEGDFSVITTLDQKNEFEDIEVIIDELEIVLRQFDSKKGHYELISMSMQQLTDIITALGKTPGAYYES